MKGPVEIKIDGSTHVVDPVELGKIHDVSAEMETVASDIAFHGRMLGAAEKQREEIDARYRQWRAEVANKCLANDPKMAEWKVKAFIESQPDFIKLKKFAAQVTEWIVTLNWACKALMQKSELLRSMGAAERQQLQATGMTTRKKKQ